jgi:UDP-N-acetylmuramoylalanine--D-glutamate ligase
MDRPTVLLLGGRYKGEDYSGLGDVLEARVKAVVAFGEAAERIELDLGDRTRVIVEEGPLRGVVWRAREVAESGDVVLLAPACSSFDMFADYEDRGRQFARLVEELAGRALEVDRG